MPLSRRSAPPRQPDPAPLRTNDVRAVTVGTVAWVVALVVLLPFTGRLRDAGHGWVLIACLYGVGLGLLGLRTVRRRAR